MDIYTFGNLSMHGGTNIYGDANEKFASYELGLTGKATFKIDGTAIGSIDVKTVEQSDDSGTYVGIENVIGSDDASSFTLTRVDYNDFVGHMTVNNSTEYTSIWTALIDIWQDRTEKVITVEVSFGDDSDPFNKNITVEYNGKSQMDKSMYILVSKLTGEEAVETLGAYPSVLASLNKLLKYIDPNHVDVHRLNDAVYELSDMSESITVTPTN